MIRVALSLALPTAILCLGLAPGAPAEAPIGVLSPAPVEAVTSLKCGATIHDNIPEGYTAEDGPYATREEAIAAAHDPAAMGELFSASLDDFFRNIKCAPCDQPGCTKATWDDPMSEVPETECTAEENPDGTWTVVLVYKGWRSVFCGCSECPPAPVPPAPLPGGG